MIFETTGKNALLTIGAALALVFPGALTAGAFGFEIQSSGKTPNMTGDSVPELTIVVDEGRHGIDHMKIQGVLRERLVRLGVHADRLELQSVATAAIEFAANQDRGVETICYETWCAKVLVQGTDG